SFAAKNDLLPTRFAYQGIEGLVRVGEPGGQEVVLRGERRRLAGARTILLQGPPRARRLARERARRKDDVARGARARAKDRRARGDACGTPGLARRLAGGNPDSGRIPPAGRGRRDRRIGGGDDSAGCLPIVRGRRGLNGAVAARSGWRVARLLGFEGEQQIFDLHPAAALREKLDVGSGEPSEIEETRLLGVQQSLQELGEDVRDNDRAVSALDRRGVLRAVPAKDVQHDSRQARLRPGGLLRDGGG